MFDLHLIYCFGAIGSAIFGGGASVLGGILGNSQSAANTAATNATQMSLAQQQDDFQEMMSNTAYQRATADMRAAGINPMLAATVGGASTPMGAQAQLSTPQVNNVMGGLAPAASSAVDAYTKSTSGNDLTKAQTANTQANTAKAAADTIKTAQDTQTSKAQADKLAVDANAAAESAKLTIAQTGTEAERRALVSAQASSAKQEADNLKAYGPGWAGNAAADVGTMARTAREKTNEAGKVLVAPTIDELKRRLATPSTGSENMSKIGNYIYNAWDRWTK